MATSTKTVIRGEFSFVITVSRTLVARVINADGQRVDTGEKDLLSTQDVVVTRSDKVVARGLFQLFSAGYLNSSAYQRDFAKTQAKPVGRIGDMFLSQGAVDELAAAVEAATAEVTTLEISAFIAAKDSAEKAAIETEREYSKHVRAVDAMMTLGGKTY